IQQGEHGRTRTAQARKHARLHVGVAQHLPPDPVCASCAAIAEGLRRDLGRLQETLQMNATHDPKLESWVESANDPACDFPIQNLPFGIFRRKGGKERPRGGVAIGDQILDLAAVGLHTGPTLNVLAAAGRPAWKALRALLSDTLSEPKNRKKFSRHLLPMKKAELFLPVAIGDYSDFFAGIYHAQNAGRLFRPDNPLLPNYHWLPIGYHGRASSIVVSGTPVTRPRGQTKNSAATAPVFGASRRLDFE